MNDSADHSPASGGQPCHRCGKPGHNSKDCRFRQAKCHKCGKQGHIAPVCRGKKKTTGSTGSNKRVKNVSSGNMGQAGADEDMGEFALSISNIGVAMLRPIKIGLSISGKPVSMELDTGAAVSVMSEKVFKQLFPHARLRQSPLVLKTYTGQVMKVVGEYSGTRG